MDLSEAEVQALASLELARLKAATCDQASLEQSGVRYWMFLEDWSEAFSGLKTKGLVEGNAHGYRLTAAGRPLAQAYHRQRPDMYWYYFRKFYAASRTSAAHSRFCERVFGQDLGQETMTDMAAVRDVLTRLDLKPGEHLLDLGCGAGAIAEYISDRTGVRVTGLDYAAVAIAEAKRRTADKRAHLSFLEGDLNALDLPARRFDAAISFDALYWVADLRATLARATKAIKPGGRIGIFILQHLKDGDARDRLKADDTDLARALQSLGLRYEATDYTAQNAALWRRAKDAATDLQADFEAEGNGFIAANWIREADEEFLPEIEAQAMTRYFYHVRL